jgi:hypothetical protein
MSALCSKNCLTRRQPIHGNFIVRIGEARPGFARDRRFSGVAIRIPGSIHDRTELAIQGSESRVDEAATIALFKFVPGQFDRGIPSRTSIGDKGRQPLKKETYRPDLTLRPRRRSEALRLQPSAVDPWSGLGGAVGPPDQAQSPSDRTHQNSRNDVHCCRLLP